FFFVSSRRRHTRSDRDWSSDVCSSDLAARMFGDMSTREADPQAGLRWGQVYLESTTGELFARFAGRGDPVDATPDLPAVRAQTLVMHRRGDLNFPFKLGQQIAASIPN